MKKDIILEKFLEGIEILKKIRETNVYINNEIDRFLASIDSPPPPPPPEPEPTASLTPEEMLHSQPFPPLEPGQEKEEYVAESITALETLISEMQKLETVKTAGRGTFTTGSPMLMMPTSTTGIPMEDYGELTEDTPAERPFVADTGTETGVGSVRARKEKSGRLHAKTSPF